MIRNIENQTITTASELWQVLCTRLSVPYSAIEVRQALADYPPEPGQGLDESAMVAIGMRLGVRMRGASGNLGDLIDAAVEAGPLLIPRVPTQAGQPVPAVPYLIVLGRNGRSRFDVYMDGRQQTVSRRWLKKHCPRGEDGQLLWYLIQPMTNGGSGVAMPGGTLSDPSLSAFRRLVLFLRPESRDIRAVFVFSVIVGILSLTTPLAVEALVNTIAFGRYLQPLVVLSLMVFVFLVFQAGLRVLMTIVVEVLQRRIFVRVVDDLAWRLARVPLAHWKSRHGPELANRFFDVVNVQKVTSKLLLESLMLALQTVIGLTVLAFYHPFLLGYDIGLLILMTVVLTIMGRGAARTALQESKIKYKTAAWLQELARHPATFRFQGGLDFAVNRADELATSYVQTRREHFKIVLRQISFAMLMQAVAATVLLGLGGYLVIKQQMTLGQLVAAELIVTVILGSFTKIGKDLESFYDLLASMQKLGQLYDLPVLDGQMLPVANTGKPASLRMVDLQIGPGQQPLRSELTAGSRVAIHGRSGTGKSRLLELMSGQGKPAGGHILLDGMRVDLAGPDSLQPRMALLRNVEIFPGSIEENLRMGRSSIGSEAVAEMLESLGLQDDLNGLPDGLNTELNISGYPLSNRQLVLLVLARALLGSPGVLLIDGLLDCLADADLPEVLQRLGRFDQQSTLVVATGRQAIAEWAGQVIDLSPGH
jgi:putative ABC transport system ATP-binding protein